MDFKALHVRNPLTVIAVFAGITEVGGTVVLPWLADAENQRLYIYFLMGFPCLLVSFFFATLWFSHIKLYAPSDFQNEDNFVTASAQAWFDKVQREVIRQEEHSVLTGNVIIASETIQGDAGTGDTPHLEPTRNNDATRTPIEDSRADATGVSQEFRRVLEQNLLAEDLVVQKFEREQGLEFRRNVFPRWAPNIVLDAVATTDNVTTILEIKVIRQHFQRHSIEQVRHFATNIARIAAEQRLAVQVIVALVFMDEGDLLRYRLQDDVTDALQGVSLAFQVHSFLYEELLPPRWRTIS